MYTEFSTVAGGMTKQLDQLFLKRDFEFMEDLNISFTFQAILLLINPY